MAEDDENVVALAEIDKINENINKTRVDGLQTLHAVRTYTYKAKLYILFKCFHVFCLYIYIF